MRDAGRITAAIEVLTDFEARRVPLKVCLADWARAHRFAGSKDRAWISGLCLDVLRRKASLGWQMQDEGPRALVLGALRFIWQWPLEQIEAAAAEQPHGAGALREEERRALLGPRSLDTALPIAQADMPDWLTAAYLPDGFALIEEGRAMAARAPVDLRINTLKADRDKALKALKAIHAEPAGLAEAALRIAPPSAHERTASVETIPAYNKGWVEVQDLGSQICALAAGDIKSKQVLDLCAGGGGKTLALAAMAGNTGQIFAWDADARRLAPIFERLRRAGARNVQVRSPADGGMLSDLAGKMDVVFVDAPCSGSGTWRRRPDTKWRLTEAQLSIRTGEQDAVLDEAATYVKSGGLLVYVTCSFLKTENEDRLAVFRQRHEDFTPEDTLSLLRESGGLTDTAASTLDGCHAPEGALRLTPARTGTDCFYVSALRRA